MNPATRPRANLLVIGLWPPIEFKLARKMDTPDKSEYVVAGIAAVILFEALTLALGIGFFFGRALG